jgi:hypothetical protein
MAVLSFCRRPKWLFPSSIPSAKRSSSRIPPRSAPRRPPPTRACRFAVGVVQSVAVTGTGTVATAVNGNAISGGSLSVTGGAAGTLFTAVPTAANDVNEDDVISFTPSGATGSATGAFFAVIRRA